MLEILNQVLKDLPTYMQDVGNWDSLVINRRKPYTYRAFYKIGELRICLHRFEVCDEHEAFPHPHPWPAAFKILKGSYKMGLARSENRESPPLPVATTIMTAGSSYEIVDPMTWHTIQPIQECYTVMVNGLPWDKEVTHKEVRTTKGKDLQSMSAQELADHFAVFNGLLGIGTKTYESLSRFEAVTGTIYEILKPETPIHRGDVIRIDHKVVRIRDIEVPRESFYQSNRMFLLVEFL